MKENQFQVRLQFSGRYHGQCSYSPWKQNSIIRINLASFSDGTHQNHKNEIRPFQSHQLEDIIIQGITYTLTHELIHHFTNIIYGRNTHREAELLVYYMIGNGGNEWFNEFFKIDEDHEWMEVIGGHTNEA